MQRILDINRRKRKYYTKPIKKMLKLVLFLYKEIGVYNISGDITINYGELHFSESEIDKERAWGLKLSNGTANLVDYELEHDPDLVTREEALEKIKQRQAENARLQPDELTAALAEEE
jgi:Ser-tRNA(Ala) deacylase AlaX